MPNTLYTPALRHTLIRAVRSLPRPCPSIFRASFNLRCFYSIIPGLSRSLYLPRRPLLTDYPSGGPFIRSYANYGS
jgi:hypothetical protein